MSRLLVFASVWCAVLSPRGSAHEVAAAMAQSATALLASLNDEQRALAVFSFADAERVNWHFVPRTRQGLPLKKMSAAQRELAHALLATALSERGHATARNIISLEEVLAALENNPVRRDPENYFFSLFGTPGPEPWGWRCEGHHLAINLTIAGSNVVVTTPHFFGANPAEVRSGPRQGFRALGDEEDRGREFLRSLSAAQQRTAIISADAPGEVLNVPGRNDSKPAGIAWRELDESQRQALLALVRFYVERFRPELAADAMNHLESAGREGLHFAWAGGSERGERHYYRVQTDWFVVEYDNTQDGANHVHTVWREFGREFGADVLAEHYRTAHAQ